MFKISGIPFKTQTALNSDATVHIEMFDHDYYGLKIGKQFKKQKPLGDDHLATLDISLVSLADQKPVAQWYNKQSNSSCEFLKDCL